MFFLQYLHFHLKRIYEKIGIRSLGESLVWQLGHLLFQNQIHDSLAFNLWIRTEINDQKIVQKTNEINTTIIFV